MNETQTQKIYLISGNDEFPIKSKAREIIQGLCGEIPEENPALEIINGSDENVRPELILNALLNSLRTPAFLCAEKIVWLKNFIYFDDVLKEKKYEVILSAVMSIIKDGLAADTRLIIDGQGIDRRKTFFKELSKRAEVFFFEKADVSDRDFQRKQAQKIRVVCAEAGKIIDDDALNYLAEVLGTDSGRINNELAKLFSYTGNTREINIDDCRTICSKTPEAMFWSFSEALTNKNLRAALEHLNTFIEQAIREKGSTNANGTAIALLKFTAKAFQDIIKVKAAAAQLGISGSMNKNYFYSVSPALKEKFPENYLLGLNPFRAYKLYESSMIFADAELVRIMKLILETNRKLVSGALDPQMALEQMTLNITAKTKRNKT